MRDGAGPAKGILGPVYQLNGTEGRPGLLFWKTRSLMGRPGLSLVDHGPSSVDRGPSLVDRGPWLIDPVPHGRPGPSWKSWSLIGRP